MSHQKDFKQATTKIDNFKRKTTLKITSSNIKFNPKIAEAAVPTRLENKNNRDEKATDGEHWYIPDVKKAVLGVLSGAKIR